MGVELPIVSFACALLVLIPLPWHWRTRNICTTSAMIWLAVCNIIRAVNTIAWLDNIAVKYYIWCDIISRVEISANIGVPAATVCVCRRLAQASAPYHRAPGSSQKRQRVRFEIGMCIVLPIILNALHVLVESCRFLIVEEFGCTMCYYPSILALFVTQIPTILLSWTALIYSGVTLRWLIHRRVQFQQASQNSKSIPASSHYLRLVAMAITQMTFASVMSLFLTASVIQSGIYPWTWEDVHENWHEVFIQTKDSLPEFYWTVNIVAWYFVPIASVATFGYFGFDDRVTAEYKGAFAWISAHALPRRANDTLPSQTRSDADTIAIDMDRRACVPVLDPSSSEESQSRDIFGGL